MAKKIRNVLLKCFLLTLILLIVAHLIYFFFPDDVLSLVEKLYRLKPSQSIYLFAHFFSFVKVIAVCFFLIPALVINCEFIGCPFCKKCKNKEEN